MVTIIDENYYVRNPKTGVGEPAKTVRDLGEIPVTMTVKPGKERAFDVFMQLAIAYKVAGVARSVKALRSDTAIICANACEAGLADGTVTYESKTNV